MPKLLTLLCALVPAAPLYALELSGTAIQGGLVFGQAAPGSVVTLDGSPVLVSADGRFVIGFGRDEAGARVLEVTPPGDEAQVRRLEVAARNYSIERVDGVPQRTVTPDPTDLERIREEAELVAIARARRGSRADYTNQFRWPARGRISGVYGSQRILNGQPARPHYGLDIAAPQGAPVYAPAAGVITLTHPDMYYSGGTVILDHGQGLSSTFLHLSEVLVEAGATVGPGALIGRVGMSGRASGPHLDWRMNWLDRRIDPQLLVPAHRELVPQ